MLPLFLGQRPRQLHFDGGIEIAAVVRLKIPEGTQNGQVFRLKGHGMPNIGKPDDRGDLYATVEVQLPRALTKDQRQHYEALQKLDRA